MVRQIEQAHAQLLSWAMQRDSLSPVDVVLGRGGTKHRPDIIPPPAATPPMTAWKTVASGVILLLFFLEARRSRINPGERRCRATGVGLGS